MKNGNEKRVLIVINTIDAGGAETFIMKVFRCVRSNGIIFDFLINKRESNHYKDEIEQLGGKIYVGYSKSSHPIKCYNFIKSVVKQKGYETVFCISNHPVCCLDLLAAKNGGAKKLLVRSTNAGGSSLVSKVLAFLTRSSVRRMATTMIAPSKLAGFWLFGKKSVNNGQVYILKNGLNLAEYKFSTKRRVCARHALNIPDGAVLLGHIGRFSYQKNHEKLVCVFKEYHAINPNSYLVLVGDGENKERIKQKVAEYGISKYVVFLGIRKDVPDLLMACDLFCLPSYYEGLPNVVVEAQATGLKVAVASTVSEEAKITDLVVFCSLNQNDAEWAECLEKLHLKGVDRLSYNAILKEKGYDMKDVSDIFESWL